MSCHPPIKVCTTLAYRKLIQDGVLDVGGCFVGALQSIPTSIFLLVYLNHLCDRLCHHTYIMAEFEFGSTTI